MAASLLPDSTLCFFPCPLPFIFSSVPFLLTYLSCSPSQVCRSRPLASHWHHWRLEFGSDFWYRFEKMNEDHQIYQVEIWVDGWMKEKSKVNIFSERFKFLRLLSSAVPVSRRQVAKALDEKLSKLPSNQRSSFLVGALGSPFLCRWEQ